MRSLVRILFVLAFFNGAFADANELTCSEIKSSIVGRLFHFTKSEKEQFVNVQFYISTQKVRRPVLIDTGEWNALKLSKFNPYKKTYFIIHGYMSSVHKNWVEDLKNSLLDYSDANDRANVIIVDWSNCSSSWNYVNTALNTQHASRQIYEFLEAMRSYVSSPLFKPDYLSRLKPRRLRALKRAKKFCGNVQWNHLYFIGHSLGAHVSGQTAYLLKQNPFWKVERITGLDPAQPCFTNVDPIFKIDKSDANFVDIIHTQGGAKDNNDGFGLNALVGHLDFYVNGGLLQPECKEDSYFSVNSKICSHKLASKYFIESIDNALIGECPFDSAPWDGSYTKAEELLAQKRNINIVCEDCPKMGITAEYSNSSGRYIVFTSATAPFCQFKADDFEKVKEVLKEIR